MVAVARRACVSPDPDGRAAGDSAGRRPGGRAHRTRRIPGGRVAPAGPLGRGLARAGGRHRRRQLQKLRHPRHEPTDLVGRAVLQHRNARRGRQRRADPPGQDARPAARLDPGAGQRQTPPPRLRHHHLELGPGQGLPRGGRGLHSVDSPQAGRSPARRRGRSVRLRRGGRRAELRAARRRRGRHHRVAAGPALPRRRRPGEHRGQRRPAADRGRFCQPQLRVHQQGLDQPQRPAQRRKTPDRQRQRVCAPVASAGLG